MSITRTIATLAASVFLAVSVLPARPQDQSNTEDPNVAAITQIVSDYAERVSRHDAHDVGSLFAEDADLVNMRGDTFHGRKDIVAYYATLFAGPLKTASRTNTVNNVRLLSSEIAAVDGVWEMVGTQSADGSRNPMREGHFDYVLTKQNDRWFITVFHECGLPNPSTDPAAK